MYELAVVVDLSREVCVVLFRGLEYDLLEISLFLLSRHCDELADLGAIAELMRRQVDFSEASLAYELSQCVVPHCLQVGRGEFTGAQLACRFGSAPGRGVLLTRGVAYTNSQAAVSQSQYWFGRRATWNFFWRKATPAIRRCARRIACAVAAGPGE